jgi:hypothetical protein
MQIIDIEKITDLIENITKNELKKIMNENNNIKLSSSDFEISLDFVGKGGEGKVYKIDKFAVKFFSADNMPQNKESFAKELLVLKNTNKYILHKVSNNFIPLHYYTKIFGVDVIVMDLVEGTAYDLLLHSSINDTDNLYLHMMFQVLYNVLVMYECLKIKHNDLTLKNILFKKIKPSLINYTIINKTNGETNKFSIVTDVVFYMSDFGRSVQIINNNYDVSKSDKKLLKYDNELHHIIDIFTRYLADILPKKYSQEELINIRKHDDKFIRYSKEMKQKLFNKKNNQYMKYKYNRALVYYLIDNNHINEKFLTKLKINLPSESIIDFIKSLNQTINREMLLGKISELGNILSKNNESDTNIDSYDVCIKLKS